MTKVVNAYKLRTNLGEYLNEVYYKGAEVVVERRGVPMVRIIKESAVSRLDNIEEKKRNLALLVGSLSEKRARGMKAAINAVRKQTPRRMVL